MFNKLMFHTPTLLQGGIIAGAAMAAAVVVYLTTTQGDTVPPMGGIIAVCGLAAVTAWGGIGMGARP